METITNEMFLQLNKSIGHQLFTDLRKNIDAVAWSKMRVKLSSVEIDGLHEQIYDKLWKQ